MHGLNTDEALVIKQCLEQFPQIYKVIIYGSRATGKHRPGSDIDITLIGNGLSTKNTLHPLAEALDNLLLPYTFDISIFSQLPTPELIKHILEKGLVFYFRKGVGLKDGWNLKTLGDIGKVSMCKRILKKQTTPDGDIPFYKIGTFGKTANAFIDKSVYEEFKAKYSYPKVGDILISASGTIGRKVIFDGKPSYFQDSNIVWIDNDEKHVLNSYLYTFYSYCDWNASKGATISRLYNADLRRIPIPVPPLSEQKQIVTILDKAFTAIDQAKANIEQNITNAKELFQSKLNQIFSQKGDGWVETSLGEIGKVSMCKRILKKQTTISGDIPFYKIGTFGKIPNAFIEQSLYENFKEKYSFPKIGDILISASGTIGRRVRYDGKPAYFQDSNIVWIDNDEELISNDYLYQFYGVCDWNPSKGATISRLYNADLRKIKISYQNLKEQSNLVDIMSKLDSYTQSIISKYQTKLTSLAKLKKSILQKAFAGELT
jgi:type I restriction enzyme S subunit